MADFLTAKQVIDLLKIDRTTLYRMLKEDRIKGLKIGSQWRFSKQDVDTLLSGKPYEDEVKVQSPEEVLPMHCIQPIQDVFAEMAQIASLTTDIDGNPLTEFSNSCKFCTMVLSTEKGRQGCLKSWKRLELNKSNDTHFETCHAGLKYSGACINNDGKPIAKLIAGQYYVEKQDEQKREEEIKKLAENFGLDPSELCSAEKEIPILEDRMKNKIGKWMNRVAKTFEQISVEREHLIKKLKNIAELTNI
jgi:excisionase family DNA binding protein